MEKRKYDMSKYADAHKETVVRGVDGTEITVRDHIPYSEKEEMAKDLLREAISIHDGSMAFVNTEMGKATVYLVAKYYTDIDVEETDMNIIADFLINNNMVKQINEYIDDDINHVMEMFWSLCDAFIETYKDDRSLTKALRTSFGFLFSGEDITESLAKAEAMKDTVYGAISAFRSLEKEKSEKIDNGTLQVGGNVISFAKKN